MDELLKRLQELQPQHTDDHVVLESKGETFNLSADQVSSINDTTGAQTIAFVDGGNACLVAAPHVSVHAIRVGSVRIKNNEQIAAKTKDFFCLISTTKQLQYKVETFPKQQGIDGLLFDSKDRSLSQGNQRVAIEEVAGAVRRFAELHYAATVEADVLVLDGSLQVTLTHEKHFMEPLLHKKLCGLAKTSRTFTKSGCSVSYFLQHITQGRTDAWYIPAAQVHDEHHQASLFFTKLNPSSQHIFKCELHNVEVSQILAHLKANAKDYAFPGYPYGLVQVDAIARISFAEAAQMRTMLNLRIDPALTTALNAHEILDSQ